MANSRKRPVVLVVLDGWGYRRDTAGNAIAQASTPTWDRLWSTPSRTLLDASGLPVGLPEGQMGNSEVGHLNLGAGRMVPQDLVRITLAIRDGSFFRNEVFTSICRGVRERGATLHLVGLIGNGGVHAVDTHLLALVDMAEREQVPRVAIHALLDGRDTLPRSALGFMRELVSRIRGRAEIASLGGRYYGMDRDKRWPRTELFFRAMVQGAGPRASNPGQAIQDAYDRGESDEFILPLVIERNGEPVATVRDGDAVICFNFRADRMRQIIRALTEEGFDGFDIPARPRIELATMTMYDETFTVPVAFEPLVLSRIVAEVLSEGGKTMFRTAETEKYAHVTYFFNGGFEKPYPGEIRELVASPQVATYDLMPEMSALPLTDVLCRAIESGDHDFILANYANGDMVGHTGVFEAAVMAVETVDGCLARVLAAGERAAARVIVTADHGNCEMMIDPESGGVHTAHTTNQVPLVLVDPTGAPPLRSGGALKDVGPMVLSMLGVEQPPEMNGRDLRIPGDGS